MLGHIAASSCALLSLTSIAVVPVIARAVPSARYVTLEQLSSNVNNCSGNVPQAPLPCDYGSYFPEYTRRIGQNEQKGWETWSLVFTGDGTYSLGVLTWALGDPAALNSNLDGLATFSIFVPGTNLSAVYKDNFVYQQVDKNVIDIGIGNNHLVFDGTYGVWNVSVDVQGFKLDITTIAVPREIPFIPSYDGKSSQLVNKYFSNIPVTRGHTNGFITYPFGEVLPLRAVTTIRHSWATDPVQYLLSSYTHGTSFVKGNTVSWFKAESISDKVTVDSAQLLTDLSGDTELNIPLIYQVTDDSSLVAIIPNDLSTTLTFQGCPMSHNNPYLFTIHPIAYKGSVTDSAGGVTKYYSTITDASLWTGNGLYVGNNSLGLIEVYTAAE